jgi:hypothetical protein
MSQASAKSDAAVSDWENEGGSASTSRVPGAVADACFPALPPGYTAQQAWGFRDPTGAFAYEFCRVYRPSAGAGARGDMCQLDEGRSFWVVIWGGRSHREDHPVGRWITYAQARKLSGAGLTFRRFSAPTEMSEEIPRLLRVAEIPPEQEAPGILNWTLAVAPAPAG